MNKFTILTVPNSSSWRTNYGSNLVACENACGSACDFRPDIAIDAFCAVYVPSQDASLYYEYYETIISLARADGYHRPAIGITTQEGGGAPLVIQTAGEIENPDWSWTPGLLIYLSDTVYGGLTQSKPTSDAQILGIALSATKMLLSVHTEIESELTGVTTTSTTTSSSTTTTSSSTTTTT